MPEQTAHPNLEVVVWPLFLPQVYWVLLRNLQVEEIRTLIQTKGKLPKWETEFIDGLAALGLKDPNLPKAIWTDDFSDEVIKRFEKQGAFSTKGELSGFLESRPKLGPNILIQRTNRLDRKVAPSGEAIGLFEFRIREGARLQDTRPTEFFRRLFFPETNGYQAAALLLGRYLTIPEPTFDTLLTAPRELLSELVNGTFNRAKHFSKETSADAHPEAGLNAFTDSVRTWFTAPKDHIATIKSLLAMSAAGTSSWRAEIPSDQIVTGILGIMGKGGNMPGQEKKEVSKLNKLSPQILLLIGPPGTGKTTIAQQAAQWLEQAKVVSPRTCTKELESILSSPLKKIEPNSLSIHMVQFHQSYAYEDFVEGLRPVRSLSEKESIRYAVVPGPLKALGDLARTYWEHCTKDKEPFRIPVDVFNDVPANVPPGEKREVRLQLLPEYKIYHFLDRPGELHLDPTLDTLIARTGNGKLQVVTELSPQSAGRIELHWRPKASKDDAIPNFVLIVDELNRGNPSKIFGEAMVLIEASKRLGRSESLPITLPYSRTEFILTNNFHLVATMNQADRSLATLDQAFRRRFTITKFLAPDFDLIRNGRINFGPNQKAATNALVSTHFENINKALKEVTIDQDRHIGHFYGIQVLQDIYENEVSIADALATVWNEHLHPLLRDLIPRRDVDKFAKTLEELQRAEPFFIKDLPLQLIDPEPQIEISEQELDEAAA